VTQDQGRVRRFNTSILVDKAGALIGKYRKIKHDERIRLQQEC
jgi:predicted amidohydrolase